MRVFLALLCFMLLNASEAQRRDLAPERVEALLSAIRGDAVVLGSGPKEIHSFIDPKCEMSRRYLQFVMQRRAMLERYTYYFYLLELKRLDSADYIGYILDAKDPARTLLTIMVDNRQPADAEGHVAAERTEERIEAIVEAAEAIGVYKRPYIIYNGKAK